jgi:2-iminobutanoate/2-iminopropanoate deaminase
MATQHKVFNIGVAGQIGSYSDAIGVEPHQRWLFTSGTPGLLKEKKLPADIRGQAVVAWENILQLLKHGDMTTDDIVKVTQYLIRAEDIASYAEVRNKYLGDARPASMLLVIPQLVWPDILVEIEVIAAKKG